MAERTSVGIRLALDQRSAQAVHAALMEALHAKLLEGERREAAREVLERLDRRVPAWLDPAPVERDAGYLIAAETVLRFLVAAEGRHVRPQLARRVRAAARASATSKPLGATATDVLERMLREKLIARRRGPREDEPWWAAAPAGRQFLHRNTAAGDASWAVHDALELLDLIYADGRGHGTAYLPWVQAIGRPDDDDLAPRLAALSADGLLRQPDDEPHDPALDAEEQRRELESRRERRQLRVELSLTGYELARTRAGAGVRLVTDRRSGDTRDRYGRLLAYVDGPQGDLGEGQLRAGLAYVYRFRGRRFSRLDRYRRAEESARADRRACAGSAAPGTSTPAAAAANPDHPDTSHAMTSNHPQAGRLDGDPAHSARSRPARAAARVPVPGPSARRAGGGP